MSDYKSGKWAAKIIELQKDDGSWGYFHALTMPASGKVIATEQAINRLSRLGFTKDDDPIANDITKKGEPWLKPLFKAADMTLTYISRRFMK